MKKLYRKHELSILRRLVQRGAALKQGIRNPETEWNHGNGITETEYGIRERRFQTIDLKKKMLAMTIK